jgi:hypothetical protein
MEKRKSRDDGKRQHTTKKHRRRTSKLLQTQPARQERAVEEDRQKSRTGTAAAAVAEVTVAARDQSSRLRNIDQMAMARFLSAASPPVLAPASYAALEHSIRSTQERRRFSTIPSFFIYAASA